MRIGSAKRSFVIWNLLVGTVIHCCCGFQYLQRTPRTTTSLSVSLSEDTAQQTFKDDKSDDISTKKFLIHWRGEKDPGYSKPFRQLEFESALAAELSLLSLSTSSSAISDVKDEDSPRRVPVEFVNALNYTGDEAMLDMNVEHFNEAMQFVSFGDDSITVSMDDIIRTVQRCSLVSGLYEIVASSDNLDDLAPRAIENGGFSDLFKGAANEKATWCFRARSYGARPYNADDKVQDAHSSKKGRTKRYSSRTRSMQIEKDGLKALTSLLIQFGGKVDLVNPDYKIYIFDGLEDETSDDDCSKILARRIASGPQVRNFISI
jgi:hypothetical protein